MSDHESFFNEGVGAAAELELPTDGVKLNEQQGTMKKLSSRLAHLKADKAALEEKIKDELNPEIEKTQTDLLQYMKSAGLTSFKTDLGTFTSTSEMYVSAAAPELAFAWLREQGHGAIIKETVHSKTLSSTIKQLCEAGELDILNLNNLGFSSYIKESIRIKRK